MSDGEQNWYYTIELAPGVRTVGHDHVNVAATRALLRGVDLASVSCLDIGTQEGMLPVLMKRAGAGHVAAYDRLDLTERIQRVKQAYQVEFDYLSGIQLVELPARLAQVSTQLADVVVLSGVLYHMINPLGGLGIARSFCRTGGLFLIETAAMQSCQTALHFNAEGKLYGKYSNYFIPTTACLDYLLRMLGLRPLRGAYLGSQADSSIIRLAVLCRSESQPCPLNPNDEWALRPWVLDDLRDEAFVRWDGAATGKAEVPLKPAYGPESQIGARQSLYDWVLRTPAYPARPDEVVLNLQSVL